MTNGYVLLLAAVWALVALGVCLLLWAEGARRFERDPQWEGDG